jgi:hypothetical protein
MVDPGDESSDNAVIAFPGVYTTDENELKACTAENISRPIVAIASTHEANSRRLFDFDVAASRVSIVLLRFSRAFIVCKATSTLSTSLLL